MKVEIGAKTFLYPMPTTLVGADVNGRANFVTIAFCGILSHTPALIQVGINKSHYTNRGIKEKECFSVNIPSASMVKETDYCGLVSGAKADKSHLFEVFYGQLRCAPMIAECPLNLECKLKDVLDFGASHEIFIGEIVETYADETILTDNLPDISKLDPILFSMHDKSYWRVGERIGKAWSIGRELMK